MGKQQKALVHDRSINDRCGSMALMRIAIAQVSPQLGGIETNTEQLLAAALQARLQGADLLVTSELALQGYPPRDLLYEPQLVQESMQALAYLQRHTPLPMLVGSIVSAQGDPLKPSHALSNGALWLAEQQIVACHRKCRLPFYDIFDDMRYFVPGQQPTHVTFGPHQFHITICEDIWGHLPAWQERVVANPIGPIDAVQSAAIFNLSASPFSLGKQQERCHAAKMITQNSGKALLYVNQVAAYDRIVFDGASFALNPQGQVTYQAPAFAVTQDLVTFDGTSFQGQQHQLATSWQAEATQAICLGLQRFFSAHKFQKVILGLSGGIDSALTAALAVMALGKDKVEAVRLPSPFTSEHAMEDGQASATLLDIPLRTISITPAFNASQQSLALAWQSAGTTLENLQARLRGLMLMALANAEHALLLTTSNKSEIAVGYATLYGDMCGGLNLIGDLYKTEVFALAHYLNSLQPMIPVRSIEKAPSAELKPNQQDTDSLPPYDLLDPILQQIIDHKASPSQLRKQFATFDWTDKIYRLVRQSEHKRWQMAPSLRLRQQAFGEGWRYPITHNYQDFSASKAT